MKRAAFFGAILGCLVLFACGAGLCCFLLVTHWLAPVQVSFQRELFFDYTQTEAVADVQLCSAVPTQVKTECLCNMPTQGLPASCQASCSACTHGALCTQGSAICISVTPCECAGGGQVSETGAAGQHMAGTGDA